MAEYNMTYKILKKRLTTLKLLTDADMNLSDEELKIRKNKIDAALKELDERYSEGFTLSFVEDKILELEKRKK